MNVFPVAVRASWVSVPGTENYLPPGQLRAAISRLFPPPGGHFPPGPEADNETHTLDSKSTKARARRPQSKWGSSESKKKKRN